MGMFVGDAAVSGITRCPACATAFRVGEAQLRARGGQVRCGRCGAQFDAHAYLISGSAGSAARPDIQGPVTTPGWTPTLVAEGDSAFDFGPKPREQSSRLWWPAGALLLFLLAAQGVYAYRGDIAVLLPEAKPLIERLCAELGCEIPLPRRPELLSIESSDLQADGTHPSVMVLTATLRNRAGFVQALPSLELTLTNAQDKTVARRVLTPREYAAKGARLEAGFAPASELQVRLYLEAPALRPTGYRLYLFYS